MANGQKIDIIFNPHTPEPGVLRRRTYAFTIDLFAIGLINKGVLITFSNFVQAFFYQLPIHAQQNIVGQIPQASLYTLITIFFSYFFLSYYLGEGKTPGKLFLGLRVYSPETLNESMTFKESFYRTLGYMVCYATGLFLFLAPFIRKDRKGLPDWFSNTQTISEERFAVLKNIENTRSDIEPDDQLSLFDKDEAA